MTQSARERRRADSADAFVTGHRTEQGGRGSEAGLLCPQEGPSDCTQPRFRPLQSREHPNTGLTELLSEWSQLTHASELWNLSVPLRDYDRQHRSSDIKSFPYAVLAHFVTFL